LVGHMRRSRPDIVVVHGYSAEVLGRVGAILARVPRSVVWVHNWGDLQPRGWVRWLADRLLDPFTSAYYGVAQGQVCYLTGELGYPAAKVRIVPNGTAPGSPVAPRDPAVCAPLGIQPNDPVVGILAALRPEKDHPTLLRAARLVIDELPQTRFLVIGDGPQRGELERLAADLGISDRVIFTGSRSDVAALLGVVDVFTLCSFTIECAPMALLEAMAAGRPAVCTAVGGVSEIIDEAVTGYLVPPRDPAALAERLVSLLGDPARIRVMGGAARARLESEFTLERSVCNAEKTIEETAGRWPVAVQTVSR
jgi:glycosyltransferase involved in cell wall biosynthesis